MFTPDIYEATALDEVTGREGSLAVIRTISGRTHEGRIFSRVLSYDRGLDAVVITDEDGHTTLRWAAIESLRTIPEAEEPTQ